MVRLKITARQIRNLARRFSSKRGAGKFQNEMTPMFVISLHGMEIKYLALLLTHQSLHQ